MSGEDGEMRPHPANRLPQTRWLPGVTWVWVSLARWPNGLYRAVIYLANQGGIASDQMSIGGFGESRPLEPNENSDGSDNPQGQQNRRVEIVVEK